jgi:hypothetical protein
LVLNENLGGILGGNPMLIWVIIMAY